MGEATAGPAPGPATVALGDGKLIVTVERVGAIKGSRAWTILRSVADRIPEIAQAWGDYQQKYRESHSTVVDRAFAMLRFGPSPLIANGSPVLYPMVQEDGTPHPRGGEVVMIPSPLSAMTEEGWAARDHKMAMPADPPTPELVAAVFDKAMEVAEDHVYRVVALLTLPNDEVNRLWRQGDGKLDERVDERVDEVMDAAFADDLLELAVVCGEVIEGAFARKVDRLGERVGNALRLVGLAPRARTPQTSPEAPQTDSQDESESTPTPSEESPPSSTVSEPNTDGAGETPSTPPTTSSSSSPDASTAVGTT